MATIAAIALIGCSGAISEPAQTGAASISDGPNTSAAASETTTPTTVTTLPPVNICSSVGDQPSRGQLLGEVDGFAKQAQTTGAGLGGQLYVVTSTADSGPGTLRDGLEQGGRWVVFDKLAFPVDRETVITVDSPIQIGGDSTLDGRCANVRIAATKKSDGALFIGYYADSGVNNVMITTVKIGPVPGQTNDDQSGDGLRIVWGSDRFYVAHVEIFSAHDEALEIDRGDRGPMRGTIANSVIRDTAKAVLVGDGTDNNEKQGGWQTNAHRIEVTFHDNWFNRNQVRNPVVIDATVHLFNNFISSYGLVGDVSASAGQEFGGNAWVWTEGNVIEPRAGGIPCGIAVINYGSLGVTGTTYVTANDNVYRDGSKFCSFRKADPPAPDKVPYDYKLADPGPNGMQLTDRLTNADLTDKARAGWVQLR
ncbi:MAG: hypothetical protein ABIQ73_29895 [Acidimicrobiales bacterium]